MPENILVVEYEPRYTDRVKQALAGQPFQPQFAKDGEEALRAIDADRPRLIVLSSVVPKVSTPELIRAIRTRKPLADTPILLTVSGYKGTTPRQDAVRMGASDILPKPYSESEFLGKVQQMLGLRPDAARQQWSPDMDSDFRSSAQTPAPGLTSNEIFGELLEDDRAPSTGARKAMKPKDDLDKMLADTLAGVMPTPKKKDAPPAPAAAPPAPAPTTPKPTTTPGTEARPRTQSGQAGQAGLDKLLNDTLSGLEKGGRRQSTPSMPIPPAAAAPPAPAPAAPPRPQQTAPPQPQPQQPRPVTPPPPPAAPPAAPRPVTASQPAPAAPRYITERLPAMPVAERVPVASPVIAPAPPPPAPAPAHEEEEPTDGTKFGQYVLIEKIATGGMAEVWKARMRGVEGFQKTVAIKKILPHLSDNQDFIEMFIDEAKLAAQLNHNNIIHIYDLGKIQSSYYIAMEYIDGHDLKTILKRSQDKDQPLQVELALFIASKIAAALDYAHRKRDFDDRDLGLVHRDVSPQNILISEEGDIKLCDFGIAKAASKASHTQAGALKGKLQYMSPEQAWGRNIDKRSDIFALATVLFELLTGRRLFTGDNELSILEQVREARVQPPSEMNEEVTPAVDAIVAKALQKDPANRYQTAGEMERDINQVLYTYKPTPTAADLAIYMHRLSSAETMMPQHSPMEHHEPVDHDPKQLKRPAAAVPVPVAAPAPVAVPRPLPVPEPAAAVPTFHEEPAKKPPIAIIAIAAVVVIGIILGVVMTRGKKPAPVAGPATPAVSTAAPQTASTSTAPAVTSTGTMTAPTTTSLDQAKIDAEVQKRLADAKARLDQQKAGQPVTPAPVVPAPQRPVPQIAQTPVPQPVIPAPQPVIPAPQPQVAAPVPQPVVRPQPAEEPVVQRAREGEEVPAGTEGLNPPRMVNQAEVTYPQVARMQRIQGVVLLSVHVSESGQVLDVKVIRGDARLSDAAVQSIRRSRFSPGTKDGVRVKSWVPVSVGFKL